MGGVILYKGYKISGQSIPFRIWKAATRLERFTGGLAGSLVEVARVEGTIFKTMKEAEAHGLELAREWVDQKTGWRE